MNSTSKLGIIGERIKRLRKAQSMTQAEFAAEIGVEPLHISNIERGKKGISFGKLERICKQFSINMVDLIPINDFEDADLKYDLIDEIVETLELLDLSQVRLIKTMVCSLQ
jgi:transcriptional regulator with XRE-family HTH domain